MAAATEVIRRSMSTLSGLFTKKLPTGIWQFTFDEVGKGMKYAVNGRRYEFLAINGVMGITIDATNEKQLWYVISDDCTVQIEEVGQSANPFFSIPHENGTWIPILTLSTPGDLALTYDNQRGYYTRIGNMVFIDLFIDLASFANTTGSGDWHITGLPFTSANDTSHYMVGSVQLSDVNLVNSISTYSVNLNPNSSVMQILFSTDASAYDVLDLANAVFGATSKIMASISYRI